MFNRKRRLTWNIYFILQFWPLSQAHRVGHQHWSGYEVEEVGGLGPAGPAGGVRGEIQPRAAGALQVGPGGHLTLHGHRPDRDEDHRHHWMFECLKRSNQKRIIKQRKLKEAKKKLNACYVGICRVSCRFCLEKKWISIILPSTEGSFKWISPKEWKILFYPIDTWTLDFNRL